MADACSKSGTIVDNQGWEDSWQQGQTGWHRPSWNPSLLRYFPLLGVAAGARVLVPLCGKSRDMDWLIRRGYQVVGLELHEDAIENFFRERGLPCTRVEQRGLPVWKGPNIEIWQGDLFSLPENLTDAEVFYDRGSLVALPPARHKDYVQTLLRIAPGLKAGTGAGCGV